MLWDENRQNAEIRDYYKKLIGIRHEYPVLIEGVIAEQYVEDVTGVIYTERILENQSIVLIFHVQKGTVELPDLVGMKNLVSGRDFSGSMGDYETVVLVG